MEEFAASLKGPKASAATISYVGGGRGRGRGGRRAFSRGQETNSLRGSGGRAE